jgi:trans-aconitate methyltransferase
MSSNHSLTQTLTRNEAYTSARSDIAMLVPESAQDILDVGCSNGALGRTLINLHPGRRVCGIELDKAFSLEAAQYLDEVVSGDLNSLDWETAFPGRSFDCMIFAPTSSSTSTIPAEV